jgi:hypothetical protein
MSMILHDTAACVFACERVWVAPLIGAITTGSFRNHFLELQECTRVTASPMRMVLPATAAGLDGGSGEREQAPSGRQTDQSGGIV